MEGWTVERKVDGIQYFEYWVIFEEIWRCIQMRLDEAHLLVILDFFKCHPVLKVDWNTPCGRINMATHIVLTANTCNRTASTWLVPVIQLEVSRNINYLSHLPSLMWHNSDPSSLKKVMQWWLKLSDVSDVPDSCEENGKRNSEELASIACISY